jgi:GntR family transcriptional repressor for pyruvate dehydrogenase complex
MSHLVAGDWREGDRLPSERDLVEMLRVGRPSLREALKAMEIMGLIESHVGGGTFVCARSEFFSRPLLWAIVGNDSTDLRQLIEARLVLEGEMAQRAAERADEAHIETIAKHLREMAERTRNPGQYLEADMAFHLAIAEAADNRILLNALLLIRNLMRQWMLATLNEPGIPARALEEHSAIFEAIRAHDGPAARTAMYAHLGPNGELLLKSVGRDQA